MSRSASLSGLICLLFLLGSGCTSKKTVGQCSSTKDCVALGYDYSNAICLNNACVNTCVADSDCACQADAGHCGPLICNAGICEHGCSSDSDCMGGDKCSNGRCALYFESFEPPMGATTNTLDDMTHQFNQIDAWNGVKALKNKRTEIVFAGVAGCANMNLPLDQCAGAAGDGKYFLSVEVEPATQRGTLNQGTTCAACACCLACRDFAATKNVSGSCKQVGATCQNQGECCPGEFCTGGMCFGPDPCLGMQIPETNTCGPPPVPSACSSACNTCASDSMNCPAATTPPGAMLTACEVDAAKQDCGGCQQYNACNMMHSSEIMGCIADPNGTSGQGCTFSNKADSTAVTRDCNRCKCPSYDDCWSCRNYETDASNQGLGAMVTQADAAHCSAQGNGGCFATPVSVTRSALTDDEQAVVSREIPSVGMAASEDLELSFEYLAFNVGQCFTKTLQGMDPSTYPPERQDLVIQFCGSNCQQSSSWVDAKPIGAADEMDTCGRMTGPRKGAIPTDNQINNGLAFELQDTQDWRNNLVRVAIPAALRTANFRFRFLPLLHDGTRIGVDRILITRASPKDGGM
jgi:hypothetical protein